MLGQPFCEILINWELLMMSTSHFRRKWITRWKKMDQLSAEIELLVSRRGMIWMKICRRPKSSCCGTSRFALRLWDLWNLHCVAYIVMCSSVFLYFYFICLHDDVDVHSKGLKQHIHKRMHGSGTKSRVARPSCDVQKVRKSCILWVWCACWSEGAWPIAKSIRNIIQILMVVLNKTLYNL